MFEFFPNGHLKICLTEKSFTKYWGNGKVRTEITKKYRKEYDCDGNLIECVNLDTGYRLTIIKND